MEPVTTGARLALFAKLTSPQLHGFGQKLLVVPDAKNPPAAHFFFARQHNDTVRFSLVRNCASGIVGQKLRVTSLPQAVRDNLEDRALESGRWHQ